MSTTELLGIPLIENNSSSQNIVSNEGVISLQALGFASVILIGLDTPPVSPNAGDSYIVGPAPTGLWAGRENTVTTFFNGSWLFIPGNDSSGTPIIMGADQEGMTTWSQPDNATYIWSDLDASPGVLSWQALPTSITTLAALSDTSITAPLDHELLVYRGGDWKNVDSNLIIVTSISDFPPPSGGVITLEDFKIYRVTVPVSIGTTRIQLAKGNVVTSQNPFGPLLTYTGTGTMFTGTDVDFFMTQIRISCPNGQLFDLSDTSSPGGDSIIIISDSIVDGGAKIGTANNIRTVDILNSRMEFFDDGITLQGSNIAVLALDKFVMGSNSPTFVGVDLTGSVGLRFQAATCFITGPSGSIGIKGDPGSANIIPGELAIVRNVSFIGDITPLSGISEEDIRWDFDINSANVEDTMIDALVHFQGNATPTVISVQSTPTKVLGTYSEDHANRFTTDTTGRITYIGERPLRVPININLTLEPSTGTNKSVSICVALNGTCVAGSTMKVNASAGDPQFIATIWQPQLVENDYFEVFVSNETDTTNILVEDCIFRVN